MTKDITNFLEIQGYIVYKFRRNNVNELIVRIGRPNYKNKCPRCGSLKSRIHVKGKWQLKKHSHFQEKQIYLEVKRNRLKCLNCKKVFSQQLPNIPKYSRKSINFETQSLSYLSKNSFKEVGNVNKVSYSTLKNQLYRYVDPHKLTMKKLKLLQQQKEIYLGFDGQSFRGQEMVLTITDVKRKEPITVLPSEKQHDLTKFLKLMSLDLREKVKGITMDMTNKHIKIFRKYFPNAIIVIDHYHVIQHSIRLVQKTRTIKQSILRKNIPIKKELDKNTERINDHEQQKLLKYFLLYPDIQQAYLFKERLRSIYKITKYKKAKQKYIQLKNDLLNSENLNMQELGRTLQNWQNEILNYFIIRITNAYTEGLHTKCKLIKRTSYGFQNVQTYVRKLILGLFPLLFILSNHTC